MLWLPPSSFASLSLFFSSYFAFKSSDTNYWHLKTSFRDVTLRHYFIITHLVDKIYNNFVNNRCARRCPDNCLRGKLPPVHSTSRKFGLYFAYIFIANWDFLTKFCSSDPSFKRNILTSLYLRYVNLRMCNYTITCHHPHPYPPSPEKTTFEKAQHYY